MRLYRETERWGRLLSLYETVLETPTGAPSGDPDEAPLTNEERLGLLGDARRVCEEKLGSRTVAFQWCARAYQVAPEDVAVVGDLERLARDADEWPAYAELLNKRLDEPDVSRQPGRDERIDLLRRLLRVNVTRLQKVDAARRCAERILELLPDDEEAERALERILEERKEWPGLVTIWRRREARLSTIGPRRWTCASASPARKRKSWTTCRPRPRRCGGSCSPSRATPGRWPPWPASPR